MNSFDYAESVNIGNELYFLDENIKNHRKSMQLLKNQSHNNGGILKQSAAKELWKLINSYRTMESILFRTNLKKEENNELIGFVNEIHGFRTEINSMIQQMSEKLDLIDISITSNNGSKYLSKEDQIEENERKENNNIESSDLESLCYLVKEICSKNSESICYMNHICENLISLSNHHDIRDVLSEILHTINQKFIKSTKSEESFEINNNSSEINTDGSGDCNTISHEIVDGFNEIFTIQKSFQTTLCDNYNSELTMHHVQLLNEQVLKDFVLDLKTSLSKNYIVDPEIIFNSSVDKPDFLDKIQKDIYSIMCGYINEKITDAVLNKMSYGIYLYIKKQKDSILNIEQQMFNKQTIT